MPRDDQQAIEPFLRDLAHLLVADHLRREAEQREHDTNESGAQ